MLGGRWPPVKNPLTFRPQVEGNQFYYPQELTSEELRQLIHPSPVTQGVGRAVNKAISDFAKALPVEVAASLVGSIGVLTKAAINKAIQESGKAALAQAQARSGTGFVVNVVYTTTPIAGPNPLGMQIAASGQKALTNVQAYIYWIH